MDHNAPTQLIFGPCILPVSSPLPPFCLFPLHYSISCLCCFCSASSLSFFPHLLHLYSVVGLICHFMARFILQASSFCNFLLFSLRLLISSASLFITNSDELKSQASPYCGLAVVRHGWGFIYIFLALSWSLFFLILLWKDLKQTENRRSVAVVQNSTREH